MLAGRFDMYRFIGAVSVAVILIFAILSHNLSQENLSVEFLTGFLFLVLSALAAIVSGMRIESLTRRIYYLGVDHDLKVLKTIRRSSFLTAALAFAILAVAIDHVWLGCLIGAFISLVMASRGTKNSFSCVFGAAVPVSGMYVAFRLLDSGRSIVNPLLIVGVTGVLGFYFQGLLTQFWDMHMARTSTPTYRRARGFRNYGL